LINNGDSRWLDAELTPGPSRTSDEPRVSADPANAIVDPRTIRLALEDFPEG